LKYSTGTPPRPRAVLLLAVLLAASCGEAHAASPVSLDVVAGIGGVVRTGRWAPFIVTVDNRGPALDARLSLEVFRGSELRGTLSSRLFLRDVELPSRSRRRFTFAAPVASTARPAVVRVTSGGDGEPRELARLEIDLHRLSVGDRLIVAVSSELAFDFLAKEGARVVYPHAENLPESWVGWSGVDLVVMRDTAFHRLGAAQVTALERWVQAGGTIVFTGGAAALQLAASGLEGLLPVDVSGLVERANVSSLGRLAGAAPPSSPSTLTGSAARDGAALLAADGDLPLVAVRRTGAGSSAWLAFDPADRAFASRPGLPALWRAVAGDAAAIPVDDDTPREPLDDPWIAPLAGRSDVSFPSHGRLAVFLAAFLLPSLALLLVPQRFSPRLGPALRAGLLVLLAAAASAAGWFVFNRWLFRGGDLLLEAARVEAHDGAARLSRHLAVCSPSGGGFALTLGPADSRVEDVSAVTRGHSPGSLAVELADAATVSGTVSGRFQSRLLVADSVIPFALSAVLEKGIEGPLLTVENRTGTVIREAFLVFDGRILPLGDIASGSAASHDVSVIGGAGKPGGAVVIADAGRRAFWERESAAIARAGPVVVGWLDEPPFAARLGGAPAAASACMVTLGVAER
jgi:hypothetical protein